MQVVKKLSFWDMRYILQEDSKHDPNGRRCINGNIGLRVPTKVIEEKCKKYMKNGKPIHRSQCTIDDAYSIVSQYQAEYRGVRWPNLSRLKN
jgi:hypothetical protein